MARYNTPIVQGFDAAGVGSENARLSFFAIGTTTFQDTFQDEALTIPNENPVTPDTGPYFPDIFLQDLDYTVRFQVKNPETGEFEQKWVTDIAGTQIADATESSKGIVELATAAEVASGSTVNVIQAQHVDQFAIAATQITGTLASSNIPASTTTAIGGVETATQTEMDNGTVGVFPDAATIFAFVNAQIAAGGGATFDDFALRLSSSSSDSGQVSEGTKWINETQSNRPAGGVMTDQHNVGGGAENRTDENRYRVVEWTSDGVIFTPMSG